MRQRFDDVFDSHNDTNSDPHKPLMMSVEAGINRIMARDGYAVLLMSMQSLESGWVAHEIRRAISLSNGKDRLVLGLLEVYSIDDHDMLQELLRKHNCFLPEENVVSLVGNNNLTFRNLVDDLIVRIYWVVNKDVELGDTRRTQ